MNLLNVILACLLSTTLGLKNILGLKNSKQHLTYKALNPAGKGSETT